MSRHCLAVDLIDDAAIIESYEAYHQQVWPDIILSLHKAGVLDMEIYRTGNRLFMIMETDENFSFIKKKELDDANSRVQEWESIMRGYQQNLPHAGTHEKWLEMKKIFHVKT